MEQKYKIAYGLYHTVKNSALKVYQYTDYSDQLYAFTVITLVTTFTHAQFEGDGYLQLPTTILSSEQR